MQTARTYSPKKLQMYNDVLQLVTKYRVTALVKMEKVRATQLMQVRKKFRDDLKIIMMKNNIAKKALAKADVKGADAIIEALDGQRAFMFTDMDPFKLYLALDKSKIYMPAKGGDTATDEIVIPAGNTGIPPGPVLSEFKEAKVPTKIDAGAIAVSDDTVVAKPGDVISHKLAGLLSKLNIKPIKAGMSIFMALEGGVLYREQDLRIDVEATREELLASFHSALALAVNLSYATTETIDHLIRKAFTHARSLSVSSGYVTADTIKEVLYVANAKAQALYENAKKHGYS